MNLHSSHVPIRGGRKTVGLYRENFNYAIDSVQYFHPSDYRTVYGFAYFQDILNVTVNFSVRLLVEIQFLVEWSRNITISKNEGRWDQFWFRGRIANHANVERR